MTLEDVTVYCSFDIFSYYHVAPYDVGMRNKATVIRIFDRVRAALVNRRKRDAVTQQPCPGLGFCRTVPSLVYNYHLDIMSGESAPEILQTRNLRVAMWSTEINEAEDNDLTCMVMEGKCPSIDKIISRKIGGWISYCRHCDLLCGLKDY